MREIIGVIGIVVLVQGAMGALGRIFTDGTGWGILPHWFDLPALAYAGMAAAGLALTVWAEAEKKRRKGVRPGA
ncbi:hypothetical protein OEIGOIKO_04446 [Streptomyces chrestomyceticus JCM 4735]|uniref:Uncharacterized protein n=1 Tax=Streptomyces chrestomyceticus JCM 4735 TaxID=1306181 RepID=A0A7U9PZU8_9ACTN|nr:hypothetical protein [Streptomyces chrestomyceticus]GCD36670.1 hypothetical protein OEIGOIKO_04446 [Streptomyces chrestomyceticus JCM 4735]